MTSNAAMEVFYPPTSNSEARVSEKIGKNLILMNIIRKVLGIFGLKGISGAGLIIDINSQHSEA